MMTATDVSRTPPCGLSVNLLAAWEIRTKSRVILRLKCFEFTPNFPPQAHEPKSPLAYGTMSPRANEPISQ